MYGILLARINWVLTSDRPYRDQQQRHWDLRVAIVSADRGTERRSSKFKTSVRSVMGKLSCCANATNKQQQPARQHLSILVNRQKCFYPWRGWTATLQKGCYKTWRTAESTNVRTWGICWCLRAGLNATRWRSVKVEKYESEYSMTKGIPPLHWKQQQFHYHIPYHKRAHRR